MWPNAIIVALIYGMAKSNYFCDHTALIRMHQKILSVTFKQIKTVCDTTFSC